MQKTEHVYTSDVVSPFFTGLSLLPGHVTGVAHPAVLLVVVAAAGLADVELAVETLAPGVEQELEGLQTSDAVRLSQAGLAAEQLSLGVFSLDFVL